MRLWSGGRRPLEGPSTAKRGVGAAPEGASMRLWSGGLARRDSKRHARALTGMTFAAPYSQLVRGFASSVLFF